MAVGYLLTPEDREAIQELLKAKDRDKGGPLRGRVPDDPIPHASDVYVVRTPDGGVAALTDEEATGTAPGPDQPGSADCDVYRLSRISGTDQLELVGLRLRCWNLGAAISPRTWALAKKDKFGAWWVESCDCSGGGCTDLDGIGGIAEMRWSIRADIEWATLAGPSGRSEATGVGIADDGDGAFSITIPSCVTSIDVECVGVGGSAFARSLGVAGDVIIGGDPDDPLEAFAVEGGGGGAWARKTIDVTPGETLDAWIEVPAPGGASPNGALYATRVQRVAGVDLIRAAAGNDAETAYIGGAGPGKGGLASDSLGDVTASGGDGIRFSDALPVAQATAGTGLGPGAVGLGDWQLGGSGGGSGGPAGNGSNGEFSSGVVAGKGGAGYGAGMDAALLNGISIDEHVNPGPGGGGTYPIDEEFNLGNGVVQIMGVYGMIRITYGRGVRALQGQTGNVIINPQNGIRVSAGGNRVVNIGQIRPWVGHGNPNNADGDVDDTYVDLDSGKFWYKVRS